MKAANINRGSKIVECKINRRTEAKYDGDPPLPQIPLEIILAILSRLPVKSLLRFRCVCQHWCSLIRDPHFVTLHLTRSVSAPRLDSLDLFITAYNKRTSERHVLAASHLGGRTTHILTLPNFPDDPIEAEHLNGLVLFRRANGFVKHNFACILNPSTRQVFKLPGKASMPRFSYGNAHICYFFGFDPSSNEYKVLNTRLVGLKSARTRIEYGIFSLGTRKWKTIQPTFRFDITGDDWVNYYKRSVCVNGVIYILAVNRIVAFDLREEKFSLIPLPPDAIPHKASSFVDGGDGVFCLKLNVPYLMQINGKLAVICHEHVLAQSTMEVWMLEDYENHFWTTETITFPEPWSRIGRPFPWDVFHTGEIMLTGRISRDRVQIPFYNMKKQTFRSIEVILSPESLSIYGAKIDFIKGCIECVFPLTSNV